MSLFKHPLNRAILGTTLSLPAHRRSTRGFYLLLAPAQRPFFSPLLLPTPPFPCPPISSAIYFNKPTFPPSNRPGPRRLHLPPLIHLTSLQTTQNKTRLTSLQFDLRNNNYSLHLQSRRNSRISPERRCYPVACERPLQVALADLKDTRWTRSHSHQGTCALFLVRLRTQQPRKYIYTSWTPSPLQ